ncbi:MAG: hypothetical protein ABI664_14100 [bacterium]
MFGSTTFTRCLAVGAAATVFFGAAAGAEDAPTTRDFMLALDAQIQRAKPRDVFRRTIVFSDVHAGAPEANVYPFTATAIIHDYNPGWPPQYYYGKTCITRIVGTRYDMRHDRFGGWVVEMKSKMPQPECADNAKEGKSAVPLDSLRGTRVGTSVALPESSTEKRVNVNLRLGEYACTYPGGGLASKFRFRLNRDKTYTDLEGARSGTYVFDRFAGTLTFHGGFLDKLSGKSIDNASVFWVEPSMTCALWG